MQPICLKYVLEKYEFCNNIVSPRTADIRTYNLKQQQQKQQQCKLCFDLQTGLFDY